MKLLINCFMILLFTQCMDDFLNMGKVLKTNYDENKLVFDEIKSLCENRNRFYLQIKGKNNFNLVVWDDNNNYKTIFEKYNHNYGLRENEKFLAHLGFSESEFEELVNFMNEVHCSGIKYTEVNTLITKNVIELDYDINSLNAYIYIIFLDDTPKDQMKKILYEENVKWIDNNIGWTTIGPGWS